MNPTRKSKKNCENSTVVLIQKVSAIFALAILFLIPLLAYHNVTDKLISFYLGLPPMYDGTAISILYYFLVLAATIDVLILVFVIRGSIRTAPTLKQKLHMFFIGPTISFYGILSEVIVMALNFNCGIIVFLILAIIGNILYFKYIYIRCMNNEVF